MTNHRPWSEISDKIRSDPARRARIEAIEREMEIEIAACEAEDRARHGTFYGSAITDVKMAAASARRMVKRVAGKPFAPKLKKK